MESSRVPNQHTKEIVSRTGPLRQLSISKSRKEVKRLKLRYRYTEAKRLATKHEDDQGQHYGRTKRAGKQLADDLSPTYRTKCRIWCLAPVACKSTRNIAALRKIHFYFTMAERIQGYMNRVKDHNKK